MSDDQELWASLEAILMITEAPVGVDVFRGTL